MGLFYSYQDSSYLTCILVFTVSSVKSSAAIGGSRVKGAHAGVHVLHMPAFGTQQPALALPFSSSSSPPLFSTSHLLSAAQLAALTPVSWLTSCSRWLIKKSWLLGFRGCFPINMNSPRSSCNIRPSPVFIQPATRSFLRNTQEEIKRVNSPFKMLHSVKGGTEPPVNGASIAGFQKRICLPSPVTSVWSVSPSPEGKKVNNQALLSLAAQRSQHLDAFIHYRA